MKNCLGLFAVTLAGSVVASASSASTITDNFQFFDNNSVVASGSFSYDSAKSGVLKFNDLTAFSITGAGNSYGLADVTGELNSYNYFGFDTVSNGFVPAPVNGPPRRRRLHFCCYP